MWLESFSQRKSEVDDSDKEIHCISSKVRDNLQVYIAKVLMWNKSFRIFFCLVQLLSWSSRQEEGAPASRECDTANTREEKLSDYRLQSGVRVRETGKGQNIIWLRKIGISRF